MGKFILQQLSIIMIYYIIWKLALASAVKNTCFLQNMRTQPKKASPLIVFSEFSSIFTELPSQKNANVWGTVVYQSIDLQGGSCRYLKKISIELSERRFFRAEETHLRWASERFVVTPLWLLFKTHARPIRPFFSRGARNSVFPRDDFSTLVELSFGH